MDTDFSSNGRVHTVSNDDSEFSKVYETRKTSTGRASHFIQTIDELNENMCKMTVSTYSNPSLTYDGNKCRTSQDNKITNKKNPVRKSTTDKKKAGNDTTEIMEASESEVAFSKKPVLVELHSYPGFNISKPTPLPGSLSMENVVRNVLLSQKHLKKKPTFKRHLENLFLGKEMQMLIHDIFWWFFCFKYQACESAQEKMFNRVAHNYTSILFIKTSDQYKDVTMKCLPDLISQVIYSIFCCAFPTSYQQFDEVFKDQLMATIHLWIVGTRPAPRCWLDWNFKGLEPTNMRRNEKIQEDATNATQKSYGKSTTTKNTPKQSKECMNNKNQIGLPHGIQSKATTSQLSIISKESRGNASKMIDKAAATASSEKCDNGKKTNSNEDIHQQGRKARRYNNKESCPAHIAPKFQKVVFDTNGRSPLVEHFLQQKNLSIEAGTSVLVQRTEIERLPPLGSKTYQDVIDESTQKSQWIDKNLRRIQTNGATELARIHNRKTKNEKEFAMQKDALLANLTEVKKISDILRMDSTKDDPEDVDIRGQQLATVVSNALQLSSSKHDHK